MLILRFRPGLRFSFIPLSFISFWGGARMQLSAVQAAKWFCARGALSQVVAVQSHSGSIEVPPPRFNERETPHASSASSTSSPAASSPSLGWPPSNPSGALSSRRTSSALCSQRVGGASKRTGPAPT